MPRKLIPLTDEIKDAVSISKLKSWEHDEGSVHVSKPSGAPVGRKKSKKILSMISQWSGAGKKFEIFSTKKVPEEQKVPAGSAKAEEIKGDAAVKGRPEIVKISSKINYERGWNISIESFQPTTEDDDDLRPKPPSRSPSFILPQLQLPTKNYLNLIKPETGVVLNDEEEESLSCEKLHFDPREKQKELNGHPVKVYKRGEEFFVKISDDPSEEENDESSSPREIATCRRAINVETPQLNLLTPFRKSSTLDLTLGKPFGIQLGSHNILNDRKTMELKGKHSLDVVIAAHGMSHRKHPANWSERDIDQILMMGAELHAATKNTQLDRKSDCSKGFTYKDNFIQVKISEPAVMGKVLTLSPRSIDLYNGLRKFFNAHSHGVLETMSTVFYIINEDGGFYVFDPRGRDEECERDDNREAALMAFSSIENVYHLILNMSKINTRAPFKMSRLKMTKFVDKALVKEEFTASSGSKECRSDDYEMLNDNIAVLQGNLSLNSAVFDSLRNRHGLACSVMAIVYAKIDPAVSWCKSTLDNVLHFGHQLHSDFIRDGTAVRNVQLAEIPAKFNIGDSYYVQISVAAYISRTKLTRTRFLFDNPITTALIESLRTFRCLLLEIDNYTFAVWRNEAADCFFFFDAYQRNILGQIDHYAGAAVLLMLNTVDHLCENVVERTLSVPRSANSELKFHGLQVIEIKKLKSKTKLKYKLAHTKCIRPFTADDARICKDAPSTIDAVLPALTKEQQMKLPEKKPTKPLHQAFVDMNSPTVLCLKKQAYEEIMASVGRKLSLSRHPTLSDETMKIMREIYSEMLLEIDGSGRGVESTSLEKSKVDSACGEFVGVAERVLLKTDLQCLERERNELMYKLGHPSDETIEMDEEEDLTLSKEKLIRSHYHELPDKTQIVRGTKSIYNLPMEAQVYDYENYAVLVGISAIVTSARYSIATWSPEIIDYVLGCAQIMAAVIKMDHRLSFFTACEHNLPKIHINDKYYDLKMSAIANGEFNQLEKFLSAVLADVDRLVVVTTCGSIAVFKRKNFHYLFEYATCNMVGYRIRNNDFGASCAMRFDNLHSLVRRIHANHADVKDEQKFILYRVAISSSDGSDKRPFVPFSASQEKIIIDALRHNRMQKREEMIKKLKENDAKVRAEKDRLKRYRLETGFMGVPSEMLQHNDFDESQLPSDDYELDLSAYERATDDDDDDKQRPFYVSSSWSELRQSGYAIDDKRIRGTFGYANRMQQSDDNELRACHFACIYAIIYAIHHPFERMSYRSVDVILENGLHIYESIDVGNFAETRALSEMIVGEMSYELRIAEFNAKAPARIGELMSVLTEFFTKEHHGVVEGENFSVAIVKDNFGYHIFDPYDSSDVNGNEAEQIDSPIASWSLHANIQSVVEHLKRCLPPDSAVKLHRILIVASKKSKAKTGFFLFKIPSGKDDNSKSKACEYVDLNENEKIEWISATRVIPWSRLERYNADGVERYTRDSKWKEYDIEMGKKLYSLWGNIHPNMRLFRPHAGKQHLVCCVVALIMSHVYNIDEWDSVLLDSIVQHGNKYLVDVAARDGEAKRRPLEMADLSGSCRIQDFEFNVSIDLVIFGKLYESNPKRFNLSRALDYVLGERKMPGVILMCNGRSLAIGNVKNETFFLYDSQSYGAPLFKRNQGTTYVLKCCCMKVLLACIVLTLKAERHNVKFHLYSVKSKMVEGEERTKKTP